MTSSTERHRTRWQARRALNHLLRALEDTTLTRRIDQPIDRALHRFRLRWPAKACPRELHRAVGELARDLESAIGVELADHSDHACREEGCVRLQAMPDHAYEHHLLSIDADPEYGIDQVLMEVAAHIKATWRGRLCAWTVLRTIQGLSWHGRRELAGMLRDMHAEHLPETLRHWPAGLLVEQIPALLELQQQGDRRLRDLLTDPVEQLP